ncbi:MAG: hypothetical protein HQK58_17940 [Deltaproteobacteria bacterium]|nr:hypothetical protein [Deltaproteobacteria bacterium]
MVREDIIEILEARLGPLLQEIKAAIDETGNMSLLKALLRHAALVKNLDEFVAAFPRFQI